MNLPPRLWLFAFAAFFAVGCLKQCQTCTTLSSCHSVAGQPAVAGAPSLAGSPAVAGSSSLPAPVTGGSAASGGSSSAPVVGLSCSDAPALAAAVPNKLLGWRPSSGERRGEAFRLSVPVDVSSPICWNPNDLHQLVQSVGSCTGEGLVQCLSAQPRARHALQADAMRAYKLATQLDGIPGAYPPDDTGSTIDAIMQAGQSLGWVGRVQNLYSLGDVRAALHSSGPIEFGGDWTAGDDNPDRCGVVHLKGATRGGHAYACFCDFPRGMPGVSTEPVIVCRNSWPDYGAVRRMPDGVQTGFFARPYADMEALFARGAEAALPEYPP